MKTAAYDPREIADYQGSGEPWQGLRCSHALCSYTNRGDHLGVDSQDAERVFAGATFEVEDRRKNYGEKRILCFGALQGRIVVIGYTPRGAVRHIFSMRKANDREKARIAPLLGL